MTETAIGQRSKAAMEALQRPFPAEDIEWRVSRCGIKKETGKPWALVLAYITARAVHDRMDEVFGLGGWKNEFREFSTGTTAGIICRLWFRDPESEDWCWKENGAAETDIESFKGGLSSSEKRAFAELGGGRYLYRLTENFAETSLQKSHTTPHYAKTKDGQVFYWGPPELPAWALPSGKAPERKSPTSDAPPEGNDNNGSNPDIKAIRKTAKAAGWTEKQLAEWVTSFTNRTIETLTPPQAKALSKALLEAVKPKEAVHA